MRAIGWAAALMAGVVLGPAAGPALAGGTPPARLTSEAQLPGYPNQGIARVRDGWVLSGTGTLSRVDEQLQETLSIADAIPADLRAEGFDHVGDVDVVGGVVHAPLEQPDYSKRRQMMARYDADTLEFLDARPVRQGHASFVTVDPRSRIAYSTDQFDDDRVLRYDTRRNWKRLPPLRLDRRLERIQGGDVADGALWMSTDDATNGLYRVDLASGHVIPLGNAGHVDGEGEGIDATALPLGTAAHGDGRRRGRADLARPPRRDRHGRPVRERARRDPARRRAARLGLAARPRRRGGPGRGHGRRRRRS